MVCEKNNRWMVIASLLAMPKILQRSISTAQFFHLKHYVGEQSRRAALGLLTLFKRRQQRYETMDETFDYN